MSHRGRFFPPTVYLLGVFDAHQALLPRVVFDSTEGAAPPPVLKLVLEYLLCLLSQENIRVRCVSFLPECFPGRVAAQC